MANMRLQIISPKKVIYDGECSMIEYTTTEGQVGVLPGHVAMTQVIAPGLLKVYIEGEETPIMAALHSGIVKIMPDLLIILAEVIEFKEDIDKERANASLERAKKRLTEKADDMDMERAVLSERRALTRLSLVSD